MLVTRVEIEAPTASFRYPHFLVGRQPSYEMPPPSTLYGHLCSAVGEWVPPEEVSIGFRFRFAGRADDLEHQILVTRGGGKLPGGALPKTMVGVVQPVRREMLFDARLTLYVRGDWAAAFRAPRYAAVLGRSQDLVSYRSVELARLVPAPDAYFEETLLPWSLRPVVLRARAETMARWIDYRAGREPHFDRFLIVRERIRTDLPDHWLRLPDTPDAFWIDPDSPAVDSLHRGVWFHSPLGEAA